MERFKKLMFFVILLTLLTACGGGGAQRDGTQGAGNNQNPNNQNPNSQDPFVTADKILVLTSVSKTTCESQEFRDGLLNTFSQYNVTKVVTKAGGIELECSKYTAQNCETKDMKQQGTTPSDRCLVGLSAAGGSNAGNEAPLGDEEKVFVHEELFLKEYLWNDKVPSTFDTTPYTSRMQLIGALRVPQDKWSFALSPQQYSDMVNQKNIGLGVRLLPYNGAYYVQNVDIGSPAYDKILRGDQVVRVNGQNATPQLLNQANTDTSKAYQFTLDRKGQTVNVTVAAKEYTLRSAMGKVIDHNGIKVGYLRYDTFTQTSIEELEKEFTELKNQNISDLIIDLRYNGGGAVVAATTLLDNITGQYPGELIGYTSWNSDNQEKNENAYFEKPEDQDGNELKLTRVFFLVSKDSASSSELVIHALKPYLGESNVILIGSNKRTHGKNVGMGGRVYSKDNAIISYYFIINFYFKNKVDEISDSQGIQVTCEAADDLGHRRGNPEEGMLKAALGYIDTGTCSSEPVSRAVFLYQRLPASICTSQEFIDGLKQRLNDVQTEAHNGIKYCRDFGKINDGKSCSEEEWDKTPQENKTCKITYKTN